MSIWQTESWQDMLIASGQSEEYFMIERDYSPSVPLSGGGSEPKWVGGAAIFVEKRAVSMGEYGLFVIGFEGELDLDIQDSLQELCEEEKCLFVQVETIDYKTPPVASDIPLDEGELNKSPSERGREPTTESRGSSNGIGSFKTGYYKKFIPPYTALIDLTQSEDEILAAMKPKGRYNIKVARKKGVVVEQVDSHIGNITKFHTLMSETTQRDAFAGNTLEYYKIFLESLDNAQIFFAYHEEEIIAAGIFVVEGDVMTYYYGASSSHKRNLMAPYLLQWTAIEHGIKRKYKIYDFLGVAGDNELNSNLAGVTDFKMKLSPKKILVSESYIFVNKKIKYQLIMLLRKLKK